MSRKAANHGADVEKTEASAGSAVDVRSEDRITIRSGESAVIDDIDGGGTDDRSSEVRKRRRRKGRPRTRGQAPGELAPEDVEKIVRGAEASLTEAYLVVIGRFAKRDIRAVDSSTRSGLGTCLMAVLQQYMPGSLSQHLPLLGLIVITGQIVVTCPPSVLPSAEEPDEPSEGSEPDKKKRRGGFFGVS